MCSRNQQAVNHAWDKKALLGPPIFSSCAAAAGLMLMIDFSRITAQSSGTGFARVSVNFPALDVMPGLRSNPLLLLRLVFGLIYYFGRTQVR